MSKKNNSPKWRVESSDNYIDFTQPEIKFYEYNDPIRCIRIKYFKIIYNFKPLDNLFQMPVVILKDSISQYIKEKYKYPKVSKELYESNRDPNELVNEVKNPEYEWIFEAS